MIAYNEFSATRATAYSVSMTYNGDSPELSQIESTAEGFVASRRTAKLAQM